MVEGLIEQGAYLPSDYNGDSGIMPHGAATLHGGRRTKMRKGRKSLRRKSRRYRGGYKKMSGGYKRRSRRSKSRR